MLNGHVLGVSRSFSDQAWRWRSTDQAAATKIAQTCGVPEVVARVLAGRGMTPESAPLLHNPSIRDLLPDPSTFMDMETGATRVVQAVRKREAIVIFGDYDVDGATSAALLVRFLRGCGAEVSAYIPDRLNEGYGPGAEALVRLAQGGAKLVVTVDCGTQAFEALAAAKAVNLDVLVVDHHKASTALPDAIGIINPNRFDDPQGPAFGHLAAVGLAFLLAVAVNRKLREAGWFAGRPEPNLLDLLDLVALGTVCDVAPLTGLNRAYVRQGLKVMAQRKALGLATLADVAGLDKAPDTYALGFLLGPRINAGGRVGRSDLGVRLLTTEDPVEAQRLAKELDQFNAERKAIEALVQEEADALAEQQSDPVIMVAGQGWHPGVIGIVAGRLKERLKRPAIVVALDQGIGKGSGRSIPGVDLGAAVLHAKETGLLAAGGGHAMAAGLTVGADKLPALHTLLNERLAAAIEAASDRRGLKVDATVATRGFTSELATALEAAGPYGAGFAAPVIASGPMQVARVDVVGQDHVRVILSGPDGGRLKAMAFRGAATPLGQALLQAQGRRLNVAGRVVDDAWAADGRAELHLADAAWAD
jgi:single-stranded-DNA-specific exonuclease